MNSFRLYVGERRYLTGAGWASLLLAGAATGFAGYAGAIWLADNVGPNDLMIAMVAAVGIITWGVSWLGFRAAGFPLIAELPPEVEDVADPAGAPVVRLKNWRLDDTSVRNQAVVADVTAYVKAIEGAFRDYFATLPTDTARDVLMSGTIRPDGKADLPLTTTVDGFLDQNVLGPLYDRLFALPVPPVKERSVEFQAVFALWGGSRSRPFGV